MSPYCTSLNNTHSEMRKSLFARLPQPGRALKRDTLPATLQFPDGSLGVIEAATSSFPGSDLRIEITGNKGSA